MLELWFIFTSSFIVNRNMIILCFLMIIMHGDLLKKFTGVFFVCADFGFEYSFFVSEGTQMFPSLLLGIFQGNINSYQLLHS